LIYETKPLHLRLLGARLGLVAGAVFGVAVETVLHEHADREEEDGGGE
jgi:hypothetical protein